MTGPGFDSLYYTDCVPGQGLRGGAGFQFQAVSPGVSAETMSLVQRTSLYEAPVAWMRARRSVTDYPPSLTHVFDGVYATARGRYLGAEANGAREGNQFTHAIATTDPEKYGLTRPAQLWGARWWAEKPAPSTECEQIDADPEAGPWGIDALREWVLGQDDGEEWLLAVHSAIDRIHEPDGQRVLFVATDPGDVLGWIAAGTVLLPQSRALRVGFRVFATSPAHSSHDVLGVHDDWAGALGDPDRDSGFAVFNLTAGRHSAVEPTEGARYWVPRFLEGDPYDTIDAIELAQRFAAKRARPSEADRLAAAVLVLGGKPVGPRQAGELASWLDSQPVPLADEVVQPIADEVLASRPGLDTVRVMHRAAEKHGVTGELAKRVLRARLAAELEHVTGTPVAAEPDQLEALAERAAHTAAPEQMDAVLRLAAQFGAQPRIGRFLDSAHRFVRWWADRPAEPVDPAAWPCGNHLTDLLRDELAARVSQPGSERVFEDIRLHWWRILLRTATDPSTLMDAAVTAAAIAGGNPEVRRETVGYVLAALRNAPPAQRGGLMWRALFSNSQPTAGELAAYLETLPGGGLGGWWAENTVDALTELCGARPSAEVLDLVATVHWHQAFPADDRLADLARQDGTVRAWLGSVTAGRTSDPLVLSSVSETVLAARGAEVADALISVPQLADAARLVKLNAKALPAVLVRELPRRWAGPATPGSTVDRALALAYLTATTAELADVLVSHIERELRRWVGSASKEDVQRIERVLKDADERGALDWQKFVSAGAAATGKNKSAGWRRNRRNKDR
ncbi:GTPase-associated protein 1-related protein [Amycolatopsis halotolerans]|uniref:GTPase-associated protein 1-related protein n=1 Tax=Amycolatopsis halotolerans TaxID=330083 RepID=A0ABV7QTN0_9PSEU